MNPTIAWPQRLIALSFIALIVIANLWAHSFLFGAALPSWVSSAIQIPLGGLIVGGGGWAWYWLAQRLGRDPYGE